MFPHLNKDPGSSYLSQPPLIFPNSHPDLESGGRSEQQLMGQGAGRGGGGMSVKVPVPLGVYQWFMPGGEFSRLGETVS